MSAEVGSQELLKKIFNIILPSITIIRKSFPYLSKCQYTFFPDSTFVFLRLSSTFWLNQALSNESVALPMSDWSSVKADWALPKTNSAISKVDWALLKVAWSGPVQGCFQNRLELL